MASVVVIGGGLGGTAAAARLAKLGHTVTLAERRGTLGGAIGFVEQDGYRWDAGPSSTLLPAVLRDLFRKSGRPLERELELVPVDPAREHRFEDGSTVTLPAGSRATQHAAVEAGLGPGTGDPWLAYTQSFADTWDRLRRDYLERPWQPEHADKATRNLLDSRATLHRRVTTSLKDKRLRAMALSHVVLDGHDPRNVPAWVGMTSYVEQNFGVWTVPGGMGRVAEALTRRLEERRVDVRLDTAVRDVAVRDGRAIGVVTDAGLIPAEIVVCAIDPRLLPALARPVARTLPAMPPVLCHLGLRGEVPDLGADEVVLHGEPTLVVRRGGTAPGGAAAWTLLGRGKLSEDIVTALARRGIDVRGAVDVRLDRSPKDQVAAWGGSPYGLLWEGRATTRRRTGTVTPVPGVYAAGAHSVPGAGVPYVGLGAALVAQVIGKA
jgi:phytoene dehydrogenase-like protein